MLNLAGKSAGCDRLSMRWCTTPATATLYAILFMQSCCITVHELQRVSTERVASRVTTLPHFGSGTGDTWQCARS